MMQKRYIEKIEYLSRFGDLLYKNLNYFWAKYFGKIENGHLLMSIFQFTE